MRGWGFRAPTHADDSTMSTVSVRPAFSIASSRSQFQFEQIASVRPRSRSSARISPRLRVRGEVLRAEELGHAGEEQVVVAFGDAALRDDLPQPRLLPRDVVVTRLRVLQVLDAVVALVPQPVDGLLRERVADLREQVGPREAGTGALGERAVEVEDHCADGHQIIVARAGPRSRCRRTRGRCCRRRGARSGPCRPAR